MKTLEYIVGLGSNLGSRQASLEAGLELLDATVGRVVRVSSLYETEPVGPPQPRYLNAAAAIESTLAPHALLSELLAIEARLGRRRRERWGPRTLDLDILWASARVADATLCVPHPRLRARAFALAPLLELAPQLAAEYEAALVVLGGAPHGRRVWVREPQVQVCEHGDSFELAGIAMDSADAAAAALSVLGRRLGAGRGCVASEVQVVLGTPQVGHELLEFVAQALSHAAAGFSFTHATLCELAPGRIEGRLIGCRLGERGPRVSILGISRSTVAGGERVVLALAQHAPNGV